MIKAVCKWLLLIVCIAAGLVLLSNIEKGIELADEQDYIHVYVRSTADLEQTIAKYPETSLTDADAHLVRIPTGQVREYINTFQHDPDVLFADALPPVPSFNWTAYSIALQEQLKNYSEGNFGDLQYSHRPRTYPITDQLWTMFTRSISYLVPGLLLGLCAGYLFALWATLKPRAAKTLDRTHALMIALPDFAVVVLLQMLAILYVKISGHSAAVLVYQFGDKVPFLIPFLAVSLLPAAIIYGTMRIAIAREWDEAYIKTAYAKGLSRSKVVTMHLLRNTREDLLTIVPRVVSVALTSLVVAEVMTGIFGLGGYAVNQDVTRVTSLPTTCAILAACAILSHLFAAFLRRKLVVQTKEGA